MSNPERDPDEVECRVQPATGVEVMTPRDVPLGGPRAMTVRRTLPQRERSLIGAWCFLDHYGPDEVTETGGMSVAPHPHTGLQTVSWLFTGEVEHRDSAGHHAMVRPGELNLMTAGHGISHSEVSTSETSVLHGAQLWVALPEAARDARRGSTTTRPTRSPATAGRRGSSSGRCSATPRRCRPPRRCSARSCCSRAGTELDARRRPDLRARRARRHRCASPSAASRPSSTSSPTCRPARTRISLDAGDDVRVLLLGGPPFGEAIVMWWNFVGRSHEEVVAFRDAWQAQLTGADGSVRRRPVRHPGRQLDATDPGAAAAERAAEGTSLKRHCPCHCVPLHDRSSLAPCQTTTSPACRATFLNCTLKRSPEVSHTQGLIDASAGHDAQARRRRRPRSGSIDHDIATGVYPDMREHGWEADDWPEIYPGILDSRHPRHRRPALARRQRQRHQAGHRTALCAVSGQFNDKGQYIFYGQVAGTLITGNEDGIKHCAQNDPLQPAAHRLHDPAATPSRLDRRGRSGADVPRPGHRRPRERLHQPQHHVHDLEPHAPRSDAEGRRRRPRLRQPAHGVERRRAVRLRRTRSTAADRAVPVRYRMAAWAR